MDSVNKSGSRDSDGTVGDRTARKLFGGTDWDQMIATNGKDGTIGSKASTNLFSGGCRSKGSITSSRAAKVFL